MPCFGENWNTQGIHPGRVETRVECHYFGFNTRVECVVSFEGFLS